MSATPTSSCSVAIASSSPVPCSTGTGAPLDRGEVSFVEEDGSTRRSLKIDRLPSGRFRVGDVDPGTYLLHADVWPQPTDGVRGREFAVQQVVVDGADVANVVLRTGRPAIVYGVVTFDGPAPDAGLDRMVVIVHGDATSEPMMTVVESRKVRANLTFELPVTFVESRKVRANLTFELPGTDQPVRLLLTDPPPGWVVKSIRYRGRDVADNSAVLETSDDPRAVEVILTNRVTYLNGRARDAPPNRSVLVLAFKMDKAAPGAVVRADGVPVAASVLVDDKGTFKLGPLEPGDYYVAAVDRDHWFDVSLQDRAAGIASLIARAERVLVVEGDQPPMTIRVLAIK